MCGLRWVAIGLVALASPGYGRAGDDREDAKQVARDASQLVKKTTRKFGHATRDGT